MSWVNPKNPLDKLIENAFNQNMEFEVLANASISKIPKIPKRAKKRAKKWKKITIYLVKESKNGVKRISAKTVKIPKNQPNFQNYKLRKPKIWIPKTNRALFKPYFG